MLTSVLVVALVQASVAAPPTPLPPARRGSHVDVHHGVSVPDPYRWMEALDAPETRSWVDAQDAAARAFAAGPERGAVRERIAAAALATRYLAPVSRRGRYFYATFRSTGGPPALRSYVMRESLAGPPRVILDGDAIASAGRVLTAAVPSPDGSLVAYLTAEPGSAWMTLQVRDVAAGRDLPDRVTGLRGRTSFVWAADGRAVIAAVYDLPADGDVRTRPHGDQRLVRHRLGGTDSVIFRPPAGARWLLSHAISRDGRWLVVMANEPASAGNRVLALDLARPGTGPRVLVGGAERLFSYVGSQGSRLWFHTDLDAPRGRIVALDAATPGSAPIEVVAQAEETISNWPGTVAGIGDRILVTYLRDARMVLRAYDARGRAVYEVPLPDPLGALWSGVSGDQTSNDAFYVLTNAVDPGTVYHLDVRQGRSARFAAVDLPYDSRAYVTEQVFYPARDGTRIPMYLMRRADARRDRPAPVLMYGYAFDWPAAPWFQPAIASWLDAGGVWALPNTRGGTEYGEAWNLAGSGPNKQTAINDYIDAADWLIRQGTTTPSLMAGYTSSAGGVILGAAIVQRPELFAAAIFDYPLLDMMRYDQFTGAAAWRYEYGSVRDSAEFQVLRRYDPIQNARAGVCYPAVLAAPGERDETTPPLHAYKFVATLQHAQSCDRPVLLRLSRGAGHASGATTEDAADTWADELMFLRRVLDRN